MVRIALTLTSHNRLVSMPRLIASKLILPLPPNKSNIDPPSKYGPIREKIASFTLSVVGLVPFPSTADMTLERNSPATIRIFFNSLCIKLFLLGRLIVQPIKRLLPPNLCFSSSLS